MARFARLSLVLALTGFAASFAGCLSSHGEPGLDVEASISSVTLADDCVMGAADLIGGRCDGEGPCPTFCRQTALQLELTAGEGETEVPFEVLEIRMISLADGSVVDTLDARSAEFFSGDTYGAWDETIAPGESLDVRYPTSAPDWATIGGGDSWSTHSMQFRIQLRVRIDGVERTLDFAPATREAEIVT